MSEFRKDMRKDIGNKKIAIVQSLVEVSGFIANLIDIIDGHSNEIDRLTAELAAEDDWEPITSVEQVEGLADGHYELKRIEPCVYHAKFELAVKNGSVFNWFSRQGGGCYHEEEMKDKYESYKLIRAFEPASPAVPAGVIENTLENRDRLEMGYYLIIYPDSKILASFTRHHEFVTMSNNGLLIDKAKYFYKLDEGEMLAALEALAKGER